MFPRIIILLAILSYAVCSAEKPNIIVIVVDDLGYGDLSCLDVVDDVKTPNIDRLAKSGVYFSNAYATAPICNASRIAIMTGSYQQRQKTFWYSGPGLADKSFTTIAETLKTRDYKTACIGKFHHGGSDSVDGRGFPMNHGFDTFYGFSGGTKHYLHHDAKYKNRNLHEGPMYVGRKKENIEGFTTELFGQQAREFIKTNKDHSFYLHLSFNAVHNFTHQLPESYLKEKDLKGFKDVDNKKNYWQWRQKIGYPAHPEGRDYYLGQLYFMDREIGLLLDQLETLKLTNNTAIFFISDNGGSLVTYANNKPLKGGKYTLFEGGTRVPFIVSFPGTYNSGKSDNLVSAMDIYPTICAMTNSEIPEQIDGLNLDPLLTGKDKTVAHDYLFWDTKKEMALRFGKWKLLITNSDPNSRLQIVSTPKGDFLFDLDKDIGETKNLATEYPELISQLKNKLKQWQESNR